MRFSHETESKEMLAAMKSGNDEQIVKAWQGICSSIAAQIKADAAELQETQDSAALMQRGYRVLTSNEKKFYNKLIEAGKAANPKQAFTTILGTDNEEDLMPTTIVEDVYKNLKDEYPLLKAINFQHTGFNTKWILNDHAVQTAVWGDITEEIVKEITSAFKVVDINQFKLSAYVIIEVGMLDLGATFLDGYIRAVLAEAMMSGLETAIVGGNGLKCPIGLIKNLNGDVSQTTGYPDKEAIAVKSFSAKEYGALVARLAETENGKKRKFGSVNLICNMTDYLTKVMPATTLLNANGHYVNNVFPFATNVIVSNAVDDGKAVMFIDGEYFLGAGGGKNGVIEYSDEYKFLEDQRVFKVKQYATGRAFDNTSALYLDISGLEEAYITVKETTVTA